MFAGVLAKSLEFENLFSFPQKTHLCTHVSLTCHKKHTPDIVRNSLISRTSISYLVVKLVSIITYLVLTYRFNMTVLIMSETALYMGQSIQDWLK